MPFITFDYKCPNGHVEESKMVLRKEMDAQRCAACKELMTRLPAGTRTTFRFADARLKD